MSQECVEGPLIRLTLHSFLIYCLISPPFSSYFEFTIFPDAFDNSYFTSVLTQFVEMLVRASVCAHAEAFMRLQTDKDMNVIRSVRPSHWGLLLLCTAAFCSQLVATGNQSSRGQRGRCQTQADQPNSPRGSLRLLVTSLGAGLTVSATK